MTLTDKILVKTLGQILRGETPDSNILSECSAEDFFSCAEKNGVLHMVLNPVFEVIGECAAINKYSLYDSKNVLNEVNQTYAWDEFKQKAEKQGIDILMLKGIYLKGLYPDPALREMCDIDFLFKTEQEKELSELLFSLGYLKKKTTACHDGWFNPINGVTMESHRIINSDEDNRIDYYALLWERALSYEENKHIFCMTTEDNFIHLLLHLRSHLKTKSANLKQLADLYIIYNSAEFNVNLIYEHLNSLDLVFLSKNVIKLVKYIFDKNFDESAEDISELADYIMGNLSFGEFDYDASKEAYLSSGSRFKSLLRHIFPSPQKIYNSFPFIKKYKLLLPLGYIYRLFQSFGIRNKNFKKKLKLASEVSSEAAIQGKKIIDFFEKYGI